MARFFDAHNHIQNYAGPVEDAAALLKADAAGVELMLCNSTSPLDWQKVMGLAVAYKSIVPCFGLHPWFIREDEPGWLHNLESFLLHHASSCVGEIGLDAAKRVEEDEEVEEAEEPNITLQEGVFAAQLRLAKMLQRPACVHCVKAWGRMMKIIRTERPGAFMFHSYGGPAEMVEEFAALGAYFSFSASIMNPRREKLREALRAVPPERLLFETDAPKSDITGLRLDLWGLPQVVSAAAVILDRSGESLAELSWANGIKFLGNITPEIFREYRPGTKIKKFRRP
ncbi:MAG: TatD family hydrolase [Elusimicrobia bacterium]|nr:TatD family hydrolase [Elusimicrobiota bacterium]